MSYTTDDYDIEKQVSARTKPQDSQSSSSDGVHDRAASDNAVEDTSLSGKEGWSAKLVRLADKLGVEQRGIERVPETERPETGFKALLNVSTMWLSANMVVAAFALGLLGQSVFGLGVADAMLVILFFNLIGITPVCFFSTFGPKFGL